MLMCCPAHPDKKASLSARALPDGRFLFHCFAGCSYREIVTAFAKQSPSQVFNPAPTKAGLEERDPTKRSEVACRIWRESRPARGTLAETYLRSRAISILPGSLRFHPTLRHPSGAYLPALVAAV